MTKPLTVSVTRKDIERGKKCRTDCCPIALAIRKIPGWERATVATFIKNNHIGYLAPEEAQDFMADFDAGLPVKPFKFKLWVGA